MPFHPIEEILQDIRLGKMVILMDDEDRENEGDLVMAAECVTAEHINFMARYARGLICMPVSKSHSQQLGLELMVDKNKSGFGTKFTASIEAASGVSTGISAADRAHTIRVASSPSAVIDDIVQPGHVFPLIADPGGVLVRAGHTEAACDLARLAGFGEAGVICEIMNDDGSMARRADLEAFAETHQLKIGTIADLIHYRMAHESTVAHLMSQPVSNEYGEFVLHTFSDKITGDMHLALVMGAPQSDDVALVRVQRGMVVRDLLGLYKPGNREWNLNRCLRRIAREGAGILVVLGGGDNGDAVLQAIRALDPKGNSNKPRASAGSGFLNVGVGSQILRALGIHRLRHMSDPTRYKAISGFGLEVVGCVQPEPADLVDVSHHVS